MAGGRSIRTHSQGALPFQTVTGTLAAHPSTAESGGISNPPTVVTRATSVLAREGPSPSGFRLSIEAVGGRPAASSTPRTRAVVVSPALNGVRVTADSTAKPSRFWAAPLPFWARNAWEDRPDSEPAPLTLGKVQNANRPEHYGSTWACSERSTPDLRGPYQGPPLLTLSLTLSKQAMTGRAGIETSVAYPRSKSAAAPCRHQSNKHRPNGAKKKTAMPPSAYPFSKRHAPVMGPKGGRCPRPILLEGCTAHPKKK